MVYDEKLAQRMRTLLKTYKGIDEKKMFGGLAFMLKGKMFCGIVKNDLMVRVGKEQNDEALSKPYARPMDFTGKPMKGYVFVSSEGLGAEEDLAAWVMRGYEFVSGIVEKAAKPKRRQRSNPGSR